MGLSDRMKKYESVWDQELPLRTPVIVRIDGRNFHSFVKDIKNSELHSRLPTINKFSDPFNPVLADVFSETCIRLCDEISGAELGYYQSDEISILINTYQSLHFEPFLGNRVQKLCSILASQATREFNGYSPFEKDAMFDARVFTLPKEEVCNYFIWRQRDWERNSVQMLGRYYFSHNELHRLSNSEIKEKLIDEEDVVWANLDEWKKNGVCIKKVKKMKEVDHPQAPDHPVERKIWKIKSAIPEFTKDREYINQHVFKGVDQDE